MLTLPSFMRIRRRAIGPSRRPHRCSPRTNLDQREPTLKIVCPKRQAKPKNCPPRIPHELSVMQKVARIAADGWKLFSGFLPSDLCVWQGCSSLPHSLWRIFFRYEQERSSTRPFQTLHRGPWAGTLCPKRGTLNVSRPDILSSRL